MKNEDKEIKAVMTMLCEDWQPSDAKSILDVHSLMVTYAYPKKGERLTQAARRFGKALRSLVKCWQRNGGTADE